MDDASNEPGAAAGESAHLAAERVKRACRRRADFAAHQRSAKADARNQGTDSALQEAQRRERAAHTRSEARSGGATKGYDRAAVRRDDAAQGDGAAAQKHRRKAEEHRSAATTTRQRPEDVI
ncbi:hypothetical protein [Amycolatopsis sp. NPDC098790]|uniref:hypothetical protein n=1 Tax=Amycolatopsis sp. NPDC098790 TaxID=3363939 RepID=UPI0038155335